VEKLGIGYLLAQINFGFGSTALTAGGCRTFESARKRAMGWGIMGRNGESAVGRLRVPGLTRYDADNAGLVRQDFPLGTTKVVRWRRGFVRAKSRVSGREGGR